MKALPVSVYKNGKYDCTNNGISSRFETLLLECKNGFITIDENDLPENLCIVQKRLIFGNLYYCIIPYKELNKDCVGWMMGGNFAYSSDSRFREMFDGCSYPIPIHDRQETKEQYLSYD